MTRHSIKRIIVDVHNNKLYVICEDNETAVLQNGVEWWYTNNSFRDVNNYVLVKGNRVAYIGLRDPKYGNIQYCTSRYRKIKDSDYTKIFQELL